MKQTVSMTLNGVELSLEIGRFAKLADGAVMVRQGDTMVLVTAVASPNDSTVDFLPLTVEYRERLSAAGKIPGSFHRREARPGDWEILSARLIDRPIRPMFPETWRRETQIIATIFSADREFNPDVLAAVGASAALMISSIPFGGPIAEVRVTRKDGQMICNPTTTQLQGADYDIVVAGTADSIVMVEGSSNEISEQDFVDALAFAQENLKALCDLQQQLMALVSTKKTPVTEISFPQELIDFVQKHAQAVTAEQMRSQSSKEERGDRRRALKEELLAKALELFPAETRAEQFPGVNVDKVINEQLSNIEYAEMREMILAENKRLDGRNTKQIRPITIEAGVLPRTHGSALFTRGETQALGTVTLGTKLDEQLIDSLLPKFNKRFMLHYNFPPYSTNEVKRMTGLSRREVGHGNLAERAFLAVLPGETEFPYTLRIVSDVLESNGSSSMATVCSGSLACFDAGVPLKKPVSGIAMGLIKEGERTAILSDILGDEDHLGDMDFKVCGSAEGITACQMDMKIQGISLALITEALAQAREGRLHILAKMQEEISAPRTELSQYAPRLTTLMIPVEAIGAVIGSGGETIRSICKETGVEINIEDDGKVVIAAVDGEAAEKAMRIIRAIVDPPIEGSVYSAKVKEVREGLGAIVEFLPKKTGLIHISQIDHIRVENVGDYLKAGDKVDVKLIEIQSDGKFRLSRKALLPVPEGVEVREERPRPPRDDRGGDRGGYGRRDDRGGDRSGGDRGTERADDRGGNSGGYRD